MEKTIKLDDLEVALFQETTTDEVAEFYGFGRYNYIYIIVD